MDNVTSHKELVWLCVSIFDESPVSLGNLARQDLNEFVHAMDDEITRREGEVSQAAIDYYYDINRMGKYDLILRATSNAREN